MPKHILFVCQSCHRSEELAEGQTCDGAFLLENINAEYRKKNSESDLEIKPVECLWACSQGCVVSVASQGKPTYLFGNLPPTDSPSALLEFMQLYIKSRKGNVIWKKIPELLQTAIVALIPPVKQ